MNTDIRIAVSFKDHRKRKKLRILLGENATDYILDLWISTAMNHPTGVLTGMDEIDIALEAGWTKDPHVLIKGLLESKFLEVSKKGVYSLHDWEEHQGYVVHAKDRSIKAKKAAERRWSKKLSPNTDTTKTDAPRIENDATGIQRALLQDDATGMPRALPKNENALPHASHNDAPVPVPVPNPSPNPKDKRNTKTPKKAFGSFENVFLSEKEMENLNEKFGEESAIRRIEALSAYVASKGKKYSSHYATILSWANRDDKQKNGERHHGAETDRDAEVARILGKNQPAGSLL